MNSLDISLEDIGQLLIMHDDLEIEREIYNIANEIINIKSILDNLESTISFVKSECLTKASFEMLNWDGALDFAIGKQISIESANVVNITEVALEGLNTTLLAMWKKLVDIIKKFWSWVITFVKSKGKDSNKKAEYEDLIDKCKKIKGNLAHISKNVDDSDNISWYNLAEVLSFRSTYREICSTSEQRITKIGVVIKNVIQFIKSTSNWNSVARDRLDDLEKTVGELKKQTNDEASDKEFSEYSRTTYSKVTTTLSDFLADVTKYDTLIEEIFVGKEDLNAKLLRLSQSAQTSANELNSLITKLSDIESNKVSSRIRIMISDLHTMQSSLTNRIVQTIEIFNRVTSPIATTMSKTVNKLASFLEKE